MSSKSIIQRHEVPLSLAITSAHVIWPTVPLFKTCTQFVYCTTTSCTLFVVITRATPRGMNITPIAKNIGKTVPAVNIGFQAGRRCCLKFVSA